MSHDTSIDPRTSVRQVCYDCGGPSEPGVNLLISFPASLGLPARKYHDNGCAGLAMSWECGTFLEEQWGCRAVVDAEQAVRFLGLSVDLVISFDLSYWETQEGAFVATLNLPVEHVRCVDDLIASAGLPVVTTCYLDVPWLPEGQGWRFCVITRTASA